MWLLGLRCLGGWRFCRTRVRLWLSGTRGRCKRVAGSSVSDVGTVPGVDPSSEGGLLGLAVDPEYPRRPYVYAYYSSGDDNRIARLTFSNNRISSPQVILDGIPAAAIHNGGPAAGSARTGCCTPGPGTAADRPNSQDDGSLGGKILRITTRRVKPAPGNPGRTGSAYHPRATAMCRASRSMASQLCAAEFGQNTWDELNAITAGGELRVARRRGDQRACDGLRRTRSRSGHTGDASPSPASRSAQGHDLHGGPAGCSGSGQIPVADGKRTDRRAGRVTAPTSVRPACVRSQVGAGRQSLWLTTSNTDGRGDAQGRRRPDPPSHHQQIDRWVRHQEAAGPSGVSEPRSRAWS